MAVRCLVFDRQGYQLAELDAAVDSIVWRLNTPGLAHIALPYTDSKCTKMNLSSGNLVLFQFDNGLPDWSGVMDFDRFRNNTGVRIAAYGAEWLLDWRVTGKNDNFSNCTAGYIYKTLINYAQTVESLRIADGAIYEGGTSRNEEYHYFDLLHQIKLLAQNSGQDFDVTPSYSGGRLSFYANWYSRKGSDKSDSVWIVGDVTSEAEMSEQGRIGNKLYAIGPGTDWGNNRPIGEATDTSSRSTHGYRERAIDAAEQTSEATLDATAAARLPYIAWPENMVSIPQVVNVSESSSPFSSYDVGDIVKAKLFMHAGAEWAYDGNVRILAREFFPSRGVCSLEIAEWR